MKPHNDDELLTAIRAKLASGWLAWVDCADPLTADKVVRLAHDLGAGIETIQSFVHPSHTAIVLTPANGATRH